LLNEGFRVPNIRAYKYKYSKNLSYKVSLYGRKNLNKWINDIGFSNDFKNKKARKIKKMGPMEFESMTPTSSA